jgi:hypothetical protein
MFKNKTSDRVHTIPMCSSPEVWISYGYIEGHEVLIVVEYVYQIMYTELILHVYPVFKYNVLDIKLSPSSQCRTPSSGWFLGVCSLNANVSEHSVSSIFIGESTSYQLAHEDGADSILKRWQLNYRPRGITQKRAYDKYNVICSWVILFLKH